MIKNKTTKALIIGACLTFSSMTGVYADTTNVEVKPAIVQEVYDDSKMMETQIMPVQKDDALANKQLEIDRYVFADHIEEIEKMGIIITSTAVVGDVVEIGITPYDVKNADYLYELFGKELVSVVAGEQAVPLDLVTITGQNPAESDVAAQSGMAVQKASFFETILKSITEWFKSIF